LPTHPACELIPELPPNEIYELGADIKLNGLRVPIVVYVDPQEKPWLLDGRSGLDAMECAGIGFTLKPSAFRASKDTPRVWTMSFASNSSYPMTLPSSSLGWFVVTVRHIDPYEYVISVNIRRRHLTAEQKRDLIETLLRRDPGKSDRQIGKVVGAHPTTVGTVRKEAEERGVVSKLDTRADDKGRQQPAHKAYTGPRGVDAPAVVKPATYEVLPEDPPEEEDPEEEAPEEEDPERARVRAAVHKIVNGMDRAARGLARYPDLSVIVAALTYYERRRLREDLEAADRLKAALAAPANVVPLFPDKPD
jgi:hypothetical protein